MKKGSFMKERGISRPSKKVHGFSSCPKDLDGPQCWATCLDGCYAACYPLCVPQCQSDGDFQATSVNQEAGATEANYIASF